MCMLFVSASSSEPMDIVVLFDMSRSESLARFEETRDYISGGFLREFVRKGDTFHLISFGDAPRLELSRRIESEGDYRTIIGRLLLLYPLAQSSSLENAAGYAETFVSELPAEREKKVVVFTAKNGFSATELGPRFSDRTQLYLASLSAPLGTLSSGRTMTPPVAIVSAPEKIPPPPVPEAVAPEAPDVPPLETVLPEVSVLPLEPFQMAPLLPDGKYEPVLFDKLKAAMIILPVSVIFLLCIVIFACAFIRKKTARAAPYTMNQDYLYLLNKQAATDDRANIAIEQHHYARGLLQSANNIMSSHQNVQ
ncbi:MAG: VWA domain-containing protein [Spirochaetaceae bacterium]|nr:VWA domain-containing protein [Spirochaetaceae bacterium]